jgi:hypothetical protein
MLPAWWPQHLFIGCFLGIGGPILGLAGLLLWTPRQNRRRSRANGTLVLLLLGSAGTAFALGQPPGIWQPPLVLAALFASFSAIRTPFIARAGALLLSVLRDRRCQSVTLILSCPALAFWWACRVQEPERPLPPVENTADIETDLPWQSEVQACPATTDRGRPVRLLYSQLSSDVPPKGFLETEKRLSQSPELLSQMLRTAPPSCRCNCFGWIFTGGRYAISRSAEVEQILQDNGYAPVAVVQVGDLAVYRRNGKTVHAGIVRTGGADGPVLVESKWGWLSCFIHPANTHCYPDAECTFYRSARPNGHLLLGLEGAKAYPDGTTVPYPGDGGDITD